MQGSQGAKTSSPSKLRGPSSARQASPPRTRVSSKSRQELDIPVNAETTAGREAFAQAAGTAQTVDQRTLQALLFASPAAKQLQLTERMIEEFVSTSVVSAPVQKSKQVLPWRSSKGKEARYTVSQFLRALTDLISASETRQEGGIAIVGNGRSVLASTAGSSVDRFPTVVRFNDFAIDQYEKHVGTKTDMWVLSDFTCAKLMRKYPERKTPVLVAIPYFFMGKKEPYYFERRKALEAELTPDQLARVTFISADVAHDIVSRHDFGDRWPSSGLLTIWHFLQSYSEIFLHGFDFFKLIDGKIHYMEDTHVGNHDSRQEERICNELAHKGRICFVS